MWCAHAASAFCSSLDDELEELDDEELDEELLLDELEDEDELDEELLLDDDSPLFDSPRGPPGGGAPCGGKGAFAIADSTFSNRAPETSNRYLRRGRFNLRAAADTAADFSRCSARNG